ncbi:MAG TPA: alpha/beta hydrolase [Rhizomicrobium sp.]
MPRSDTSPPAGTEDRRIAVRGDTLAVWDRPGDRLPFVLLHGNGCSKEAFRALFDADALAEHRLVAFDLPGCGQSSDAAAPETTYSLPGLADLAVDAVAALGVGRHVLLGWSLGGHVAIETILHGSRAAGIVLTGTPPCGPDPAEIGATFLPVPGAEFMTAENPSAETRAAFAKTVYAPAAPGAALAQACERADGKLRKYFFGYVFAHPELEPQRMTVANWPRPIALVQGPHEPFFDPKALDGMAWGNLWRGGTQWIEGAGHAPHVSHPQTYARVLAAFAEDLVGADAQS